MPTKEGSPAGAMCIDWRDAWIIQRRDVYLAEGSTGIGEALRLAEQEAARLEAWVAAGGGRLEMAYKLKPATVVATCKSEFYWLVELFLPGDTSLGQYHTGFTHLDGASRTTQDPREAKKYNSFEEAHRIATKMHSMQGEWRATEHEFHCIGVTPK